MNFDDILVCIFAFVNIFALLGLKFQNKTKQQFNDKKFYKICPCKKMADNGSLSTICMYLAMGGFLYSGTSLGYIGFKENSLNILFILSLLMAYLGWKLKLN